MYVGTSRYRRWHQIPGSYRQLRSDRHGCWEPTLGLLHEQQHFYPPGISPTLMHWHLRYRPVGIFSYFFSFLQLFYLMTHTEKRIFKRLKMWGCYYLCKSFSLLLIEVKFPQLFHLSQSWTRKSEPPAQNCKALQTPSVFPSTAFWKAHLPQFLFSSASCLPVESSYEATKRQWTRNKPVNLKSVRITSRFWCGRLVGYWLCLLNPWLLH